TATCWPSSTPASVSISASAIPVFNVGENVPDVVTPALASPSSTVNSRRSTARRLAAPQRPAHPRPPPPPPHRARPAQHPPRPRLLLGQQRVTAEERALL